MKETTNDPLAELVIDESSLAREELAAVLRPYVRFTREGGLILEGEFETLTTLQRVACVLLALRASQLLGFRSAAEASPSEIISLSGMAPGSVRPKLSELARVRLVGKQEGKYVVPVNAVRRAAELVKGEKNGR